MSKIISRKGFILIVLPLATIFIQIFLRIILGKDLNTIGITLASLGIGQLFPFIYFDHFIANKVLGVTPTFDMSRGKFTISYKLTSNYQNIEQIEEIKNYIYIAIILNLLLFMVTIYFGLTGQILLHTIFGLIMCFVSWYILIFK